MKPVPAWKNSNPPPLERGGEALAQFLHDFVGDIGVGVDVLDVVVVFEDAAEFEDGSGGCFVDRDEV